MLIDVLIKSRKSGYLGRELPGSLTFFPNNTLCLRRSILKGLGEYDPVCERSEDVEICARISRSEWLLFLCTDMLVLHRARATFRETLAQWWGYGRYVPYIFHKYNQGQCEVHLFRPLLDSSNFFGPGLKYRTIFYCANTPITVCIFITPFIIFHFFLLVSIVAHYFFWLPLSHLFDLITLTCLVWYCKLDLTRAPLNFLTIQVALVRYLVNWAFVLSHFIHGLRYSTLYIPQTICERAQGPV